MKSTSSKDRHWMPLAAVLALGLGLPACNILDVNNLVAYYAYINRVTAGLGLNGETVTVNRYTLRYDGGGTYTQGERLITEATLTVFEGGRKLTVMRPQRNVHTQRDEQAMTEVAIRTTLREDLYVILSGMGEDGRVNLRVIINPLMMWMWIGAGVLTVGTLIAFWPQAAAAAQTRARPLAEAA